MAQGKKISLALQGGGTHGAFTWGVLDRLLEEDDLEIDGISATSAGAMNAAMVAHGLTIGGRGGAKEKLAEFWHAVAESAPELLKMTNRMQMMMGAEPGVGVEYSPAYVWTDFVTRMFAPQQFNPMDINPLRDVLERVLDVDKACACAAVRLFINATNVRTNRLHVFHTHEVTIDALMASACLPFLFRTVEIGGEAFWDGGYVGNPSVYPLIRDCAARDVVVVHVNPINRDDIPTDARAIMNRVNELSFNSSIMREMENVILINQLIDEGALSSKRLKRVYLHAILDEDLMRQYSVASKAMPDMAFISKLHEAGRRSADHWLHDHLDDVGQRDSADLKTLYL